MTDNSVEDTPPEFAAGLQSRLHALARFLPTFEAKGFVFSTPSSSADSLWDDDDMGPEALTFMNMCYEVGWVRGDFHATEWMATPEADRLRNEPSAMLTATPEQLARVLTVLVRGEKWMAGTLQESLESGLLLRIVRRAAALSVELANDGGSERPA